MKCVKSVIQMSHWKSLRLCIALGSCAIGKATLQNGERVFITWGRNLNEKELLWYQKHTTYEFVCSVDAAGQETSFYELILPKEQIEQISNGLV